MNFAVVSAWVFSTIFPRRCVGCGIADESICPACLQNIVLVRKQRCVRCRAISDNGKTCLKCKKYCALDYLLAAAHYEDGPIKEAVHTLKYHGRHDLFNCLNDIVSSNSEMLDAVRSLAPQAIIVPVPLHNKRLWQRGFNQSEPIARATGSYFSIPLNSKLLIRHKQTSAQARLHRAERLTNLEGSFKTIGTVPKTVIIMDDIATTGATLNACARALKDAGAKKVIGLVVARAD